jgi:hypothetical protein
MDAPAGRGWGSTSRGMGGRARCIGSTRALQAAAGAGRVPVESRGTGDLLPYGHLRTGRKSAEERAG